jgi:hypothetical protein
MLFCEWGRRRVEGGGGRECLADEVQQGDNRADEVELDDSSPRGALFEPGFTRILQLEVCGKRKGNACALGRSVDKR